MMRQDANCERLIERPVSVKEAAEAVNVSERFLWEEIYRGNLRCRKLSARLVRISPQALQNWWESK
jgi:excisionase family DNA binding protein